MKEAKAKKLTFFSKEALDCPVCSSSFYREDLLSGSGRLIAGDLTDELRRIYQPSKKFGAVFPLVYPVLVCPVCYYAAYQKDFLAQSAEAETMENLRNQKEERLTNTGLIFDSLDFTEPRRLEEGAASYFLALACYDHSLKNYSPSIKRAMSAIRGAWLFDELHRNKPSENYDYLKKLFYRKARFYYHLALDREQTGEESMSAVAHLGPDLDKNYAYEGVLYITGLMEYKYGPQKDVEKRVGHLDNARKIVARVHGMGRASKSKPSAMLDKAKDLYKTMSSEVKKSQEEETGQ